MPSRTLAFAGLMVLACSGQQPVVVPPDASVAVLETKCLDGIDNNGDGKTDCDDLNCQLIEPTCKPYVPPVCGVQKDCGSIVDEIVTNCCLGGKCLAPGEATKKGEAVTAQILFDLAFSAVPSTKPKTVVLRFIYPKKLDGTILSCADIEGLNNCLHQLDRSKIDNDGDLNQVFRNILPLDFGGCSGSTCQFPNNIATVPKGDSYILYGEAWYGPRDASDLNNPTGDCADSFCIEGKTVSADNAHYALSFTPH